MTDQKPNTCYALRLYTYDYYEWEKVYAVSFDPKLLCAHFEGLNNLYADRQIVDSSEHSMYAKNEKAHWTIEPINFLPSIKGDLQNNNQRFIGNTKERQKHGNDR